MADRILIVEDDAALGAQIVEHLQGAGFETEWIDDGDAARVLAAASAASFLIAALWKRSDADGGWPSSPSSSSSE